MNKTFFGLRQSCSSVRQISPFTAEGTHGTLNFCHWEPGLCRRKASTLAICLWFFRHPLRRHRGLMVHENLYRQLATALFSDVPRELFLLMDLSRSDVLFWTGWTRIFLTIPKPSSQHFPGPTPCDYWLFQHLKSLVFEAPVMNVEGLKQRVIVPGRIRWKWSVTLWRIWALSLRRRSHRVICCFTIAVSRVLLACLIQCIHYLDRSDVGGCRWREVYSWKIFSV